MNKEDKKESKRIVRELEVLFKENDKTIIAYSPLGWYEHRESISRRLKIKNDVIKYIIKRLNG